jgi:hypothetical protein
LQVTALTRTGEPLLVDAACPADSTTADGTISVPPAPGKLSCTFTIQGMPPTQGVISALVRVAGVAAPLPVQPAEYYLTPGSSDAGSGSAAVAGQSSCLKILPMRNHLVKSSSITTTADSAGAADDVKGMPVLDVDKNFPVGSVCDSISKTGYTVVFGPFGASDCGSYTFESQWQVTGADAVAQPVVLEQPDITFELNVQGCVKGE